jgi:VWFA-related protein
MLRTLAIGILTATLAATQQAPQQPPPPTFKVEVNYVEIDARVTDAQGNFVRDLTQSDFQILEDGKPQTITAFTRVDLPVERHDPPLFKTAPIEPDVQSNLEEFTGRVWLLVLDDLQTKPSRTLLVRAAARQFIQRYVSANDLAAVITTGGFSNSTQDFTNSQARLIAAVNKFIGQKPQREMGSDMERGFKARNTYSTLRNLADYLAPVHGRRKAVLWIGEGVDYNITNDFTSRDASTVRDAMREVVERANRQNVTFYGIDARGVGAGLDEAIEISGVPDETNDDAAVRNEVRLAQDSLRFVSEETGGFAIIEKNDMNASFERIVRDNSSYYVLGYYSSNEKPDGKFHKLEVRVSRTGLRVQSRNGYNAPKSKPAPTPVTAQVSPEVRDALANPVPTSGVGLTISAAPFSGPGSKSSVAMIVEVNPRALKFVEQNGRLSEGLEVHVLAFDQNGKMQDGGRTNAPMELSPRTAEVVQSVGFRVTRRLTLPPGRYLIRVAARELNGGAIGTVAQTVDVPDFTKGQLNLSGITLTSDSASRVPTANPDAALKDVLPAPATAIRMFPQSDTLSIYAEVYDNQNNTPHRVAITSTVLADDGRVMFTASDERSSADLQGKKGGYGYQQQIPLTQFSPGRYVLRIQARSLASNNVTAAREVEFRVR